jgi:glucosamine 6-phosphate synthetase-like amidotransferase/phosphosugar isomerase protein
MMNTTEPMLADIARQPAVLRELGARAPAFLAAGREVLTPGAGGRVIVAGCGDGLFAAEAVAAHACGLGLDWRPMGALDLVLTAPRLRPSDRVVCISMSGNVDRTVEAATATAQAGAPILALVNGGGGRLGAIAKQKISLDLADLAPFLCGTASYTATMLALAMLASGAAGRDQGPDVETLAQAVAAADEASLGLNLPAPTGVRLLAAGADRGTVAYGAAKFVELTRIPAWSADLEEFAHSQYWAMPTGDLVAMIATDPVVAGYAQASCEALGRLGVATLAIDTAAVPVTAAGRRITVEKVGEALQPLVNAVPMQHLAYRLSLATGLDPNRRTHLKADEARFTVSRMLTRRSLIGTGK